LLKFVISCFAHKVSMDVVEAEELAPPKACAKLMNRA
jgi:hypothetical protein